MNLVSIVLTIMIIQLVMGLGFLSHYSEERRIGKSTAEAWSSYPGVFFILSILLPLLYLLF
ncbi:MAG: hypothetical protein HN737_11070 [Desulfobacterales bacterium]|nr:hypothetical protein [Desulfobacteraceae bacterium]MBT4364872.1 hypothetical protein [Desulfobacteraceae bacterium]MBT7086620.1 hypothetical protein [Desulfobacterales bacterium]MBT7697937.1 hypothetical protein [Desulfobacterales bacterium]